MLTVTDTALERLAEALDEIQDPKPQNACFRIVLGQPGKLSLGVGTPEDDDRTFEQEGTIVLVVSEEIAERCEGRTLDADEPETSCSRDGSGASIATDLSRPSSPPPA